MQKCFVLIIFFCFTVLTFVVMLIWLKERNGNGSLPIYDKKTVAPSHSLYFSWATHPLTYSLPSRQASILFEVCVLLYTINVLSNTLSCVYLHIHTTLNGLTPMQYLSIHRQLLAHCMRCVYMRDDDGYSFVLMRGPFQAKASTQYLDMNKNWVSLLSICEIPWSLVHL